MLIPSIALAKAPTLLSQIAVSEMLGETSIDGFVARIKNPTHAVKVRVGLVLFIQYLMTALRLC